MTRLAFEVDWLPEPGAEVAFGPERATWARLLIAVDGDILTRNRPAGPLARDAQCRDFVIGPLSGLVEWAVEAWPFLLWELPTPFPKHRSTFLDEEVRIPSLMDAAAGWPSAAAGVSRRQIAAWQHRHSLGHASSDLALPSLVFVPEERSVILAADHAPSSLAPSVAFDPQRPWPRSFWLSKDEVADALGKLIRETANRASGLDSGREWASWIREDWGYQTARASNPEIRRSLRLGAYVDSRWKELAEDLGPLTEALSGLVLDAGVIDTDDRLSPLRTAVEVVRREDATAHERWRSFAVPPLASLLPPHRQGYELAERVRQELHNLHWPIVDVGAALSSLDVDVIAMEEPSPFRAAAVAGARGRAHVLRLTEDRAGGGVAPARFATFAALGRALADPGRGAGHPFGAGIGVHSRWLETKRANAFAAEMLLPRAALDRIGGARLAAELDEVCDDYGISRSAARWHVHNRFEAAPA